MHATSPTPPHAPRGSRPAPPDRGHLPTEHAHADSHDIEEMSAQDAVLLIARDHRMVALAVERAAPALAPLVEVAARCVGEGGRLIYFGAGTSGRLGVLDASECPPTFSSDPRQVVGVIAGGDGSLRRSSEGREDEPEGAAEEIARLDVGPRDCVVGIAAGGTTPYTLGAIRLAKERGAATALVTSVARDAPRGCDLVVSLETGAEVIAGSTRLKAGSAAKLALNILSTLVFVRLGKVHGNRMVDLAATNEKLRDRAIRLLVDLAPPIDREVAARRLDEAGGSTKLALLMTWTGLPRHAAETLLAECGGRLRDARARAARR